MSLVDLENTDAASFLHGLGVRGKISGQFATTSFTFFSGETRNFSESIPLPADADEVASITYLKFTGVGNTDVNGIFLLVPGTTFFRNSGPSYDVQALITRSAGQQHILIQLYNPTVASNQTPPAITIDYKSLFFHAPW